MNLPEQYSSIELNALKKEIMQLHRGTDAPGQVFYIDEPFIKANYVTDTGSYPPLPSSQEAQKVLQAQQKIDAEWRRREAILNAHRKSMQTRRPLASKDITKLSGIKAKSDPRPDMRTVYKIPEVPVEITQAVQKDMVKLDRILNGKKPSKATLGWLANLFVPIGEGLWRLHRYALVLSGACVVGFSMFADEVSFVLLVSGAAMLGFPAFLDPNE